MRPGPEGTDQLQDETVLTDWLLSAEERGNPDTELDRRRAGVAWTTGNAARLLVDGHVYFARLYEALRATQPDDWVEFTDWEGDPDEHLVDHRAEVGPTFAALAERGVRIRGLLWRSHPRLLRYSEEDNFSFTQLVNRAGGQVMLDQRVRRIGSHHQKLVAVMSDDPRRRVAFVGGIDLARGRRDDREHLGDPQAVELDDDRYGERPPWHDIQIELRGPVVDDIAFTFAERWTDPAPLDRRTPWRRVLHRKAHHPVVPGPLPPDHVDRVGEGTHAVQVLRTYPARRTPYPFARAGERSVARAYEKAFARARRLVYIEDQYLWSLDATRALTAALRREPSLQLVIVIPRYPDPSGALSGAASRFGRMRVLDRLYAAGGDRVAVYDLENAEGTPIYVHAKLCVVDDLWMVVGSDNLNRRSWTHDSELSCAVVDTALDDRAPTDPAGRGEGARRLARSARLETAAEHLGRAPSDADDLVDPDRWFVALRAAARDLDDWHDGDQRDPRPPGHLRAHPRDRIPLLSRPLLHALHRTLIDPDGRPAHLARARRF